MRFHNLKFFFCQFSRFIQDFFIHTDFSDIMQRRSKCDHGSGIPIQMILFGFLRQSLQKHLRKFVNVKHMASALSVSKLHNMTENMNKNHWIEDIPVIMMSGADAPEAVKRAYALGAVDFVSKPCDAQIVYQRVTNTMKLYAKQRRLTSLITAQINEKEKNSEMLIHILSHIVNVKHMASALSVSKLHNMTEIMKTHTVIGAEMLEQLGIYQNEPLVKIAHQICRWHHERYDGKGYPDGLVGDEIPISAQVVSVADVYDALASERVYKKAVPHEKVLEMILHGECGQFNPILIECLQEISSRIRSECYDEEQET